MSKIASAPMTALRKFADSLREILAKQRKLNRPGHRGQIFVLALKIILVRQHGYAVRPGCFIGPRKPTGSKFGTDQPFGWRSFLHLGNEARCTVRPSDKRAFESSAGLQAPRFAFIFASAKTALRDLHFFRLEATILSRNMANSPVVSN